MNLCEPDLTGEAALRFGLFGKLIVQVEYRVPGDSPGTFECRWKDATLREYLCVLGMQEKA